MDLRRFLVLASQRWILLSTTWIILATCAFTVLHTAPTTYVSRATLVVVSPTQFTPTASADLNELPVYGNPLLNFTAGLNETAYYLAARIEANANLTTYPALANPGASFELRNTSQSSNLEASSPFIQIIGRSQEDSQLSRQLVGEVLDQADLELSARQTALGTGGQVIRMLRIVEPTSPVIENVAPTQSYLTAALLTLGGAIFLTLLADRILPALSRMESDSKASRLPISETSIVTTNVAMNRRLSALAVTTTPTLIAQVFVVSLLIVPAGFVIVGLPISVTASSMIGLAAAIYYTCSILSDSVGLAEGRSPVRMAVGLYAFAHAATYAATALGPTAADEMYSSQRVIVGLVGPLAVCLIVIDGATSVRRIEAILHWVVGCGVVVALIGLLQFSVGLDITRAFQQLPILRESYEFATIIDRANLRRPASTTAHPIEFGVLCAMILPFALYFVFASARKRPSRILAIAAVAIISAGALVSISRSAALGVLVAVSISAIGWTSRQRIAVLIAALLGSVGAVIFADSAVQATVGLFTGFRSDPSVLGRLRDYDSAWTDFQDNPVLGRGFGTWLSSRYNILDNQYLLTLLENGLIGILSYSFLYIAAILSLLHVYRHSDRGGKCLCAAIAGSLGVAIVGSATFDMLSFPVVAGLTFVLIGCAGGLRRASDWLELRPMQNEGHDASTDGTGQQDALGRSGGVTDGTR